MTPPILQFGTSRFLQAHVDLFVSEAGAGPIAVVQTTNSPESRRRIDGFRAMPSFPVLVRGLQGGQTIDRRVDVASVRAAFHADANWPEVVAHFIAAKWIVSNTGDAGYRLDAADRPDDVTPRSFPAKLLALLQQRHRAGAPPPVLLPCELISHNGDTLRDLVLQLGRDWGGEAALLDWIAHDCIWANSLVDRIVSEALEPAGAVAEPYALWAIQAQPGLAAPCTHPDMRMVEDLVPYERLKLFILNLGHTVLAERWLAERRAPEATMAETMADPQARDLLDAVYQAEVLPVFAALGMGHEAETYRDTVLDRFANPFLRHRLADIAGNHATKKQRRIAAFLALAHEVAPALKTPLLSRCVASGI